MKALTVQQPWAWAIFHGKNIENRTQLWKYRGPLAIHAGQRWSEGGEESAPVREAFRNQHREYNGPRLPRWRFVMGAIIGVVDLVDAHEAYYDNGEPVQYSACDLNCEPWGESGPGVNHLVLSNARRLPVPLLCRGSLGLWTPPADIIRALEQVPAQ